MSGLNSRLKSQVTLFFYALSYFTRIPIPAYITFNEKEFHKANAYFPLVGVLIACLMSVFFYLCHLFLSLQISLILMLVVSLLLTGALHEDGFADCCDGFGGGYNAKQRLKIMKDSQIGSYGGIALVLLLLLKYNLLLELAEIAPSTLCLSLVIAHTISRYGTLCVMQSMPYVRLEQDGKVQALSKKLPAKYFFFTSLNILFVIFLLPVNTILSLLLFVVVTILLLGKWFKRSLGGYTGDCLGFSQQSLEILILIILTVLLV
ncbi:adenosylcobinamide-GDP ribazoletransferase [Psychromonas sp. KJ10-10]|uniref:adenosylcobinamide-GDP ribazoletransferase n=1 Tax=Psychromonas sp. KJ10-10 TaxID=3391823 RepID=UPI0039B59803